jgi:branched-chain amino acid transport system substrate-binding protein
MNALNRLMDPCGYIGLDRVAKRGKPWPTAFGLVLALCSTGFMRSPALAQEVVRFGASLSLTGATSAEGKRVKDGYDFYAKLANERGGISVGGKKYKVEIKYYDDESNAQRATTLVERLIVEDKVNFVAGPYGSGTTFPASSVAEKYRIPMVIAHGASTTIYERGYKYIFAVLTSIDQYTINMIKMAAERGAKTVALIGENALFPKLGIDGAAVQAKDAGLEVVYKEYYPSKTTDLSAMLSAAWAQKPDVLLAAGYTADMILLARQASELGVRPKMLGFLLGPTVPGFVESLGRAAEYTLEPIQWAAHMPWKDELFGMTAMEYAQRFRNDFGYEPDYHPPQSTAALEVYQRAIEKAGSLDPQKVRDAIAATDLKTAYGPIRFNDKGQNIAKGMGVIQIQNGRPAVVYPTEYKEADLIYPMPAR